MSFRFLSRAPLALAIAAILVVPSAAVGATRDTQDTQTTTDTTVYDNATGGPVGGPLAVPASVFDGVVVSSSDGSTPVGSVEFFFSTTGCSGQFTSIGTGTVNESGVAASPDQSDLGPGSYAFEAIFHGIESYGDSTSGCEPFVVGQTSDAAGPTVTKDATGSYSDTYSWTIEKSVDNSEVNTSGPATFTYTVSVSHGPGHVGNVQVGGTIDVLNGDAADETLASITDQLSNGTECFVDTSGGLVVGPGDTRYTYSCDLGDGLPQGDVTNAVTIAWPEQTLDNGEHLAAGSSIFTTPVSFTATEFDTCVDVSDPMEPGSPSPHHFCVGDTGDPNFSFSYSKTFTDDPAGTCTRGPAILIADFDDACRDQVAHTLARAGYRTQAVRTGADAMTAASRERPLAAILEVNLLHVNGYEVCRALKERFDVPVIFLSGYRTEPLDRVAGLLVGADDYMVKPFDPDELLARVRRLVPPQPELSESDPLATLTPREHEVLQLIVDGYTPAEAAAELVIAPKTIETHVHRITGKLGVHSRSQAITVAVRQGVRPRVRQVRSA